jgi:hypothetical protein
VNQLGSRVPSFQARFFASGVGDHERKRAGIMRITA